MPKTKYPSLYISSKPKKQKTVTTYKIPTKTLHDIQDTKQQAVNSYITIFGYSPENLENVKNEIPDVTIVNSGKNWMNIEVTDESQDLILAMNKKKINGEIIGVYSNVDKVKVNEKKKGMISRVLEYLFG